MSTQRPPALRRRTFLLSIAGAAGALALPTGALAAPPTRPALAFDGDALLLARGGLKRITADGEPGQALPVPGEISALASHPGRPGRILAAGAGALVLSDDGGKSWQVRDAGLPGARIQAISIAAGAPDTFHAALAGDGLWQSEDAGLTWSFVMDRPWLAEAERHAARYREWKRAFREGECGLWNALCDANSDAEHDAAIDAAIAADSASREADV